MNKQLIESLNQKAKELNQKRQSLIGRKEYAEQSYNKAVLAYKTKFGVELNSSNLQEEYSKAQSELERDVQALQTQIAQIESGELTQEQASPQQTQQYQAPPQPQAQPQAQPSFNQPSFNQPTFNQPAGVTQPEPTSAPTPAPSFGTFQAPDPAFNQPTPSQPQQTQPSTEESFTPTGWGSVDHNKAFENIVKDS